MTRYNVWLDGQSLSSLDPAITVTDVREQQPRMVSAALPHAKGHGQRIIRKARQSVSVQVIFTVRERDPLRRRTILQRILAWASEGGCLTASHRPGQQLAVDEATFPDGITALRWTEDLSLTFTANAIPFWQEALPVTATQASAALLPPGDAPACPLDLRWQHTGAASAVTLTIATSMSSITFQDLPIAAGQTLSITHEGDILHASVEGVDALPYRTALSSDDLLLPCGQRSEVSVTTAADVPQTYTLMARGRWL